MSLKAYNGMMTKKGLAYIQENLKNKLPEFENASFSHLAKSYAKIIVNHVDKETELRTGIEFQNQTSKDKELIKQIDTNDTTILSYLFHCAKVLSKSDFANDFTVQLNMSLEVKGRKILVYPNILVPEHRKILLSFLEDWYAQNQCDPDENVPRRQWNQRCKDWWDFDNTRGLEIKICLFDSNHYWNNIVDRFRGDEMIEQILEKVPDDKSRKEEIWKLDFLNSLIKEEVSEQKEEKSDSMKAYWKSLDYYKSKEGQVAFKLFKKNNPITLKKIDKEFLLNHKLEKEKEYKRV